MTSPVQRQLLVSRLSKIVELDCKLCHGPLPSPSSASLAPCHAHCLSFACPGCVEKHRPTFALLDMQNAEYGYHCAACMAEADDDAHSTSSGGSSGGGVRRWSSGSFSSGSSSTPISPI